VTVGYERIRGLRDIGQRRSGTCEASKSKTLPVPIAELYRAFSDGRMRRRWLPGVELTVRTAVPEKAPIEDLALVPLLSGRRREPAHRRRVLLVALTGCTKVFGQ